MSILVTGGAGYIGSHVCKALAKKGYTPVTLDNLSLGHRWAVKWGPLIEGNICDSALVTSLCKKHQFLGVIHLAALSNVRESLRDPLRYYHNNVVGSLALIEVLKEQKVPFFVLSSTCSIYGVPKKAPISEDHPKSPINSYGASKWMIEQILQDTSNAHGMQVAALRYFNASGADLEGEIGEAHSPETHLIPLLIETALRKRPSFTLNGEDHDTPDGTPIRDFIHVEDLAEAHVKALEWMIHNQENLTLNLGVGKGHSVKEIIQAVEKTLDCSIPFQVGNRFLGDPPTLIANADKAAKILGWRPQYSDLSTIISTAWEWHKKQ